MRWRRVRPAPGRSQAACAPLGGGERSELGAVISGSRSGAGTVSNSDPITGQAGWYDVRVRIYPAGADEPQETSPQFEPMRALPGVAGGARRLWQTFFAGRIESKGKAG